MNKNQMTEAELKSHIQFFKNDPTTLSMVGNSKLAKAVGITSDDIETTKILTEGLLRKLALIEKFDQTL